MLTYGPFGCGS